MKKPKRLRYSDLRDMYNADEIDAWLEHEKNRLVEVIRGERAEAFRVGHCCGGMRE